MLQSGMMSGGASSGEPPLIDFGGDDNSNYTPPWPPEQAPAGSKEVVVDPFSWSTDELYISAIPKDPPFGFEGFLFPASASSGGVDPFGAGTGNGSENINNTTASLNNVVGGGNNGFYGSGMDLLTGMMNDPFAASTDLTNVWAGSSLWDPPTTYDAEGMNSSSSASAALTSTSTRIALSNELTTTDAFFNDSSSFLHSNDINPFLQQHEQQQQQPASSSADQQPMVPVFEDFSFVDALSEDLPCTESPLSRDAAAASIEQEGNITSFDVLSTPRQERSRSFASFEGKQEPSSLNRDFRQLQITNVDSNDLVTTDVESIKTTSSSSKPTNKVTGPPQKPPPGLLRSPSTSRSPTTMSPGNSVVRMPGRQTAEFTAAGGGKGIYRSPSREFVNSGHPVAMELRPRPLRTDACQTIKTLLCTDTAIWAAFDCGLKVWDIETAFGNCSAGDGNLAGDEDAAPYTVLAVNMAPTLCLAMDVANQIVWSGHRDGKVRAWPLQVHSGTAQQRNSVAPVLVWDAHQAPVTALTITSYGES